MVYDGAACTYFGLLSLISQPIEGFQADGLQIVEQIREYKDARYVLASIRLSKFS